SAPVGVPQGLVNGGVGVGEGLGSACGVELLECFQVAHHRRLEQVFTFGRVGYPSCACDHVADLPSGTNNQDKVTLLGSHKVGVGCAEGVVVGDDVCDLVGDTSQNVHVRCFLCWPRKMTYAAFGCEGVRGRPCWPSPGCVNRLRG